MSKVLMTNLYFQKYTGSEFHTLEIANQFVSNGYEVTVCVFSKAYPLLAKAKNFKVIDLTKETLKEEEFDIVFAQHFAVIDYLCVHYNISYKTLIVSKLSSFNDLESLPSCYPQADVISVVSEECQTAIRDYSDNIFIFKNSVEPQWFIKRNINSFQLKRIAVISNHVPDEIYELKSLASNYSIDYIGAFDCPREVNVALVQQYDLVITIGRTAQQCFASQTPVYVYDYFGGPGYINKSNMVLAEKNNFSGRGFERSNAYQILEDIEKGYDNNLSSIEFLQEYAKENFNLEKTFNKLLQIALEHSDSSYKKLGQYSKLESDRLSAYTNLFPHAPFFNPEFVSSTKIYFDYGNGFNEENTRVYPVSIGYPVRIDLDLDGVQNIRFDPSENQCKCRILNQSDDISINSFNSNIHKDGYDYFFNMDPQYLLNTSNLEKLSIQFIIKNLSPMELEHFDREFDSLSSRNKELEKNIGSYIEEINILKEEMNRLNVSLEKLYYKLHPLKKIRKSLSNEKYK